MQKATPDLWTITDAKVSIISPAGVFDVIKDGGLAEDGSIEIDLPQDQVVAKEDATGEYMQLNFLHSNKSSPKIATMNGSPLHAHMTKVWAIWKTLKIKPQIKMSFTSPKTRIMYVFQGAMAGMPNEKIQGTLDTVEINLVGQCKLAIDAALDLADEGIRLINNNN